MTVMEFPQVIVTGSHPRSIIIAMRLLPLPNFRRLLILPVAMSGLLCLVLAYGLHSVERRSLAVVEADLVIAHSNNLIKLMVDEETGLRGYLLTKNPVFLQPFHVADKRMDAEFLALFGLLRNVPNQTKQLAGLQTAHQDWKREAKDEISSPTTGIPGNAFLLTRKQKMDSMRREMDIFADWAETRRSQTLAHALRSNRIILFASVDFAISWQHFSSGRPSEGSVTSFRRIRSCKNNSTNQHPRWLISPTLCWSVFRPALLQAE